MHDFGFNLCKPNPTNQAYNPTLLKMQTQYHTFPSYYKHLEVQHIQKPFKNPQWFGAMRYRSADGTGNSPQKLMDFLVFVRMAKKMHAMVGVAHHYIRQWMVTHLKFNCTSRKLLVFFSHFFCSACLCVWVDCKCGNCMHELMAMGECENVQSMCRAVGISMSLVLRGFASLRFAYI